MKPTLLVGDFLVVSKVSYGLSNHNIPFSPQIISGRIWPSAPQRGDIVVFRPPHDPGTDFIKRVIGIPGDRIQFRNGTLLINGKEVEKKPAGTFSTVECGRSFDRCWPIEYKRYEETLPNGVKFFTVYQPGGGRGDATQEFVVKPGHYFMLGDNRNASEDSRFWQCEGPDGKINGCPLVPAENLVGRATFIWFSVDEQFRVLRPWEWLEHIRFGRIAKRLG
jgi:signal peptidase I